MLLNIPEIFSFNLSYLVLTICSIMLILITIKIFFLRNLLSIVIYLSTFSIIIALIYLLTDAPDVALTEVALGACVSTIVLLNVIKKIISLSYVNNLKSITQNTIVNEACVGDAKGGASTTSAQRSTSDHITNLKVVDYTDHMSLTSDKVGNFKSTDYISNNYLFNNKYKLVITLILSIIFIFILLKPLLVLPQYGLINSPIATEASKYYIEHTKQDIGIKSTIAAILAAYRGYDTLGETIVILIAGLGVLLIIANNKNVRVKKISDH